MFKKNSQGGYPVGMSIRTWLGFLLASILISLSPGPGAVASMTSGARYGFRHGYWNTLGLQLGLLAEIFLVAIGFGTLLLASPMAFVLLKWFGIFYLAYLGFSLFGARSIVPESSEAPASSMTRSQLVFRGFLINISNPKAILFMLAILPQFISTSRSLLPQYSEMALTMVCIDALVMAGYTLTGRQMLIWFRNPIHRQWIDRSMGLLFIAAALWLFWH